MHIFFLSKIATRQVKFSLNLCRSLSNNIFFVNNKLSFLLQHQHKNATHYSKNHDCTSIMNIKKTQKNSRKPKKKKKEGFRIHK